MIPALPAASYLAEGLEMISMDSMEEDWMVLRYSERSLPDNGVGLPSIYTCTPFFPLRLRLSSLSTIIPGDFRKSSRASCPTALMLPSTFRMILSAFTSTGGLRALTTASLSSPASFVKGVGGACVDPSPADWKTAEFRGSYPTWVILTK